MKRLFNIDAEGRSIARALRKILDKAKSAGIARPSLYFESEGYLYVLDEDHPVLARGSSRNVQLRDGQDAVVAQVYIPVPHDVGAW